MDRSPLALRATLIVAFAVALLLLAGCAPGTDDDTFSRGPLQYAASEDALYEATLAFFEQAPPVDSFEAVLRRNLFGTPTRVGDYNESTGWGVFRENRTANSSFLTATATSLGAERNVVGVPVGPASPVIHAVAVVITEIDANRSEVQIDGSRGPDGTPGAGPTADLLIEVFDAEFGRLTD